MKKPSQVKNYVKYVATRPNAEKFEVNQSQREATEHQKRWIEKELKANKELRVLSGKLNDAPSGRLFRADFRTLQMCQSL